MALLGALFVAALGIAPDDGIDPMLEDLGEEIAERPAEVGADVGESAQSGRRGRRPSLRTRGRFAMSFRGGTAGAEGPPMRWRVTLTDAIYAILTRPLLSSRPRALRGSPC